MIANFSYLLIGNSRLHWALIDSNNKYKFTHTKTNDPFPKEIDFKKLMWASVGNYSTNKFEQKNQIKTKDFKLKNLPVHFGVDRALNCFSALRIISNKEAKDLIIADLGTTLTITKMNAKGEIIGGQLMPGFTTQLKSMEDSTKNLYSPKNLIIPKGNFLLSTHEAMLKGVFNSILGSINLSFNQEKDILILCGGDANLIGKTLTQKENQIIIEPNLSLIGMMLFSENKINL